MPAAHGSTVLRLPISNTSPSCPAHSPVWGFPQTTATRLRGLPLGPTLAVPIILGSCATPLTLGTSVRRTITVASPFVWDFPITLKITLDMGTERPDHSAPPTSTPPFSSRP